MTALIDAIRKNDPDPEEVAALLLSFSSQDARKKAVNAVDKTGGSALHYATISGDMDLIVPLLNAGADPNAENQNGVTPLHLAALYGDVETISTLLNASAKVDTRARNGRTPLYLAAFNGVAAEAISALTQAGANPDARANDGTTPLEMVATKFLGLGGDAPTPNSIQTGIRVVHALLQGGAGLFSTIQEPELLPTLNKHLELGIQDLSTVQILYPRAENQASSSEQASPFITTIKELAELPFEARTALLKFEQVPQHRLCDGIANIIQKTALEQSQLISADTMTTTTTTTTTTTPTTPTTNPALLFSGADPTSSPTKKRDLPDTEEEQEPAAKRQRSKGT